MHLGVAAAILVIALVARAVTANRYVKRRLSLSAFLATASILAAIIVPLLRLSPDAAATVRSWEVLVLILAGLNAIVILAIDPEQKEEAIRQLRAAFAQYAIRQVVQDSGSIRCRTK
jgi:hypothetical protein